MIELASLIAGRPKPDGTTLMVESPYSGETVGSVVLAGREDVEAAIQAGLNLKRELNRHQRAEVLERARGLLETRREEYARGITLESGLCLRETRYEVGRALDVLRFAAIEALRDDGEVLPGDVSPQGKPRKIFTLREPVRLAVAITPFNHPLNQVVHKVAPAIAAGAPMILKPSEKTPLTALRFAQLLTEAGLPEGYLSVLLGPTEVVAEPLVRDPRVEVVTFTGSVAVGKRLATIAGYKRLILELGGNDPLIVLADADLELAAHLAAEGAYRNSGQRCTAVKRILVEESVYEPLALKLVQRTQTYRCGNPMDADTVVGTVIHESAALHLEQLVRKAVSAGARVRAGGKRNGALLEPTVVTEVPRDAEMVMQEAFGPLAPMIAVKGLDDAIAVANSTAYGLSAGVVTRNLEHAIRAVKALRCGTVNINEIPGYRTESSPFGGVKDSGLGIKEGVVEAVRGLTTIKTFSLPW